MVSLMCSETLQKFYLVWISNLQLTYNTIWFGFDQISLTNYPKGVDYVFNYSFGMLKSFEKRVLIEGKGAVQKAKDFFSIFFFFLATRMNAITLCINILNVFFI